MSTTLSTPNSTDARDRILLVAEEAFASQGFDRPSLRDITSKANVNLASVSYYFGSRDGLVDAVILRAIRRWNDRRVELLDVVEEAAEKENREVTLHEIVAALVDPMLENGDQGVRTEFLGSVLSRSFGSGDRDFPAEMRPAYEQVSQRFEKAFMMVVPELAPREVFWRVFFGIGGLFRIFSHGKLFTDVMKDLSGDMEREWVRRQLIQFIVGGLQAPSTENAANA